MKIALWKQINIPALCKGTVNTPCHRVERWEVTYKSAKIPIARTSKHPRFAIPRKVITDPLLLIFPSLRGSGLCRMSSGSRFSAFMRSGMPHCAGEGESAY